MKRLRTDISGVESIVVSALKTLRDSVEYEDEDEFDDAMTTLESFAAVALRLMAKQPASKVKSAAMDVEIQLRLTTHANGGP